MILVNDDYEFRRRNFNVNSFVRQRIHLLHVTRWPSNEDQQQEDVNQASWRFNKTCYAEKCEINPTASTIQPIQYYLGIK